jgi:hypothetical protein
MLCGFGESKQKTSPLLNLDPLELAVLGPNFAAKSETSIVSDFAGR